MSTAIDLHAFDALTFDCYGTLIDWERGILDALRLWATAHHLDPPGEELLAAFAESESRHEATTPAKPYPDILQAVLADIAGCFGVAASAEDCRAFGECSGHKHPHLLRVPWC